MIGCMIKFIGVVRTDVTKHMPWLIQLGNRLAYPIMYLFQKSAKEGCYSTLQAVLYEPTNSSSASSASLSFSSKLPTYIADARHAPLSKFINEGDAKWLWEHSEAICYGGDFHQFMETGSRAMDATDE